MHRRGKNDYRPKTSSLLARYVTCTSDLPDPPRPQKLVLRFGKRRAADTENPTTGAMPSLVRSNANVGPMLLQPPAAEPAVWDGGEETSLTRTGTSIEQPVAAERPAESTQTPSPGLLSSTSQRESVEDAAEGNGSMVRALFHAKGDAPVDFAAPVADDHEPLEQMDNQSGVGEEGVLMEPLGIADPSNLESGDDWRPREKRRTGWDVASREQQGQEE